MKTDNNQTQATAAGALHDSCTPALWVERLTDKDNVRACAASEALAALSERSPVCYAYFERFAALLTHKNSFVRNRALRLLAANVKWDDANRFDGMLAAYLSHITDAKPITARQCIKALPEIARCKPALRPAILAALQNADTSAYAQSMRPLVEQDRAAAREAILRMQSDS